MNNSNSSAFPFDINQGVGGLTKREYFAGLAMQAYITGQVTVGENGYPIDTGKASVRMADELLQALTETQQDNNVATIWPCPKCKKDTSTQEYLMFCSQECLKTSMDRKKESDDLPY